MINRKDEHVDLALKQYSKNQNNDFDSIRFVYNALSSVDYADVDLSVSFDNVDMDFPFYINAMTGGSEKTKKINEDLADIAKECNIAIASGSLSSALKDESLKESFEVIRKHNPDGLVFANVGAEYNYEYAQTAIDIIAADALQVHINLIQELIMPEGDRQFKDWPKNIEEIIKNIKIPVIVKEVGFGISKETVNKLILLNVKNIDLSGMGGTNFAAIENNRRINNEFYYLENFGLSTVSSLLDNQENIDKVNLLASGGIRNALDIVKCLALGAKAVGISGLILNTLVNEGKAATINLINSLKHEIKVIMTILNSKKVSDLLYTNLVVYNDLVPFCQQRNINTNLLANRQKQI